MLSRFYAPATRWLYGPDLARRIALIAFVCTLPSLSMGLQADDYILRGQVVERGPFAAYAFQPLDPQATHAEMLDHRSAGRVPWWSNVHARTCFFRPLSSLSLWLDFAHGAAPWWMHLENCACYALIVWLAVTLYGQLGLSGAGLGWASVFFGLNGAFAVAVGWIAGRNTLLAACFGLASVLVHDRARRAGRPLLLALSCSCFALSLLSAELGLCTLGYLCAHAWAVDRAPPLRRAMALSPYAALTGVYLVYYVSAGYGSNVGGVYRDVLGSPGSALLAFVESIPLWLATTATLPIASFQLLVANVRLPLLVFSLVVLALLVPLIAARWKELPGARMFGLGALLSLVPLASAMPQERLGFFVAFGVYGLLGPWIASDFDAPERMRRALARFVWETRGVYLPLLFVPMLFSVAASFASGAANALDRALPRDDAPTAILLNPPHWSAPWYQAVMRATRGETNPASFSLYAGTQALELERVNDRSLELHAPRSWFTTPFERMGASFRAGDRIALAPLTVELREVDEMGAPKRARFTFDRSLDDPGLTFWLWKGRELARWTPPAAGGRVQLPAASAF
jgi:hypothetical protein